MAISLNSYKIFCAVADHKSISKTAEAMYLSQPAISKVIRSMEDELQMKLFYRYQRNGLQLTQSGEKILLLARELLKTEEKIYQMSYRENHFLGGKLRVASVPIMNWHLIVKAVAQFQKQYPLVQVELIEGTTNQVKQMVIRNEVDLGVSISPFEQFYAEVIYHDRMVAITKKVLSEQKVNFANDQPYIICRAGFESTYPILEKKMKKVPNFQIIQGATSVRYMVAENIGVGIISELGLGKERSQFHVYEVEPSVEMEYAIIANHQDDLTPVACEFIQIVHRLSSQYK